jgi:hypothetical protein
MPLHHGRTAKGIRAAMSKNIRTEIRAGYPRKQAIAIGYSIARADAKRAHIRTPKGIR